MTKLQSNSLGWGGWSSTGKDGQKGPLRLRQVEDIIVRLPAGRKQLEFQLFKHCP